MKTVPPIRISIDFVSDVFALVRGGSGFTDIALRELAPEVVADVRMQPFELNPGMAPEGVDAAQYLTRSTE